MTFRRSAGFALLLTALAQSIWADATLRYRIDFKSAQGVGMAIPLGQALGDMRDIVIQIKGNKAYSSQGKVSSIMDLKTQELTMIDVTNKRFATVPASQYADQAKASVGAVPEQARALLASMKTNVESRSTGRTETIQGIQAEEREFVLTLDMAIPGGPAIPGPFMKMTMQLWTAKPEEAQRVPALQELKNYTASSTSAINPAEVLKQLLGAIPGLGDNFGTMVNDMTKEGGVALRTHMEIAIPLLVLMSQQMPQQPGQPPPPALDPNAPLLQMTQELADLSSDPIDDAIFQVPADYRSVSLAEILKGGASLPPPPTFKQ